MRMNKPLISMKKLIDDVQCYDTARLLRWPVSVCCPHCSPPDVIKRGMDETEPARQKYRCKDCGRRFDDLTDTVFAGHPQPLRVWMPRLYLMGLNLSNMQIAGELDLNKGDVQAMAECLRGGVVKKKLNPC
jgi:transposase-like protein